MAGIDLSNSIFQSFKIEPGPIPANNGDVRVLMDSLTAFHTVCALSKFDVVQDAVDPTKYSYEFEAQDGRKWKQVIWINGSGEPSMTFSVSDPWQVREFVLHRPVRDVCIVLIKSFGCTRIRVRW